MSTLTRRRRPVKAVPDNRPRPEGHTFAEGLIPIVADAGPFLAPTAADRAWWAERRREEDDRAEAIADMEAEARAEAEAEFTLEMSMWGGR